MGDRISIKFVDSREEFVDSSTIYFHWAGLHALKVACDMIDLNITERPGTAMANLAYLWGVRNGGPSEMSVYLDEDAPNDDERAAAEAKISVNHPAATQYILIPRGEDE